MATTTLADLRAKKDTNLTQNLEELQTLSTEDLKKIMPNKEEENSPKQLFNNQLNDLDAEIDRRIEKIEQEQEKFTQEVESNVDDELFDLPVEDIDMGLIEREEANKMIADVYKNAAKSIEEDPNIKAGIEAVSNVSENKTIHPENMELDDLLKDLDDSDDEEEDDTIREVSDDDDLEDIEEENDDATQQKMIDSMKKQLDAKIKPFTNIIDLKSYKISTKVKSAATALKEAPEVPTATWVLLESGVPITCSALSGLEIESLDPKKTANQYGRIDAYNQMYGTLFRHYESPNKPEKMEDWIKTIAFADQDNLFFAYYKATYGLCNLMNYECSKCHEVKIQEVPIENCVKYKDDEIKKEVQRILNYGDSTYTGEIKADLIQITDKYAVAIKYPSIYNMVYEFGVLDSEFTNKHADALGIVAYIEQFYEIDNESHQLIPIVIKESKNVTQSVKRRIRAKVEMLKTLTPDQYNILVSTIAKFAADSNKITYCQPAYTCEKCNTKIEEVEMTAQGMLFTRHQLVLIKSL